MQSISWAAALLLVALPMTAAAVELGNKEKGYDYAQKFCSECHGVEADDRLLLGDVPTFKEVADSEGMSPRALSVWLQTSHPNMPDFIIKPDDMDDVIAYIMSLKSPRQ
jgi:cytochrome c2